MRLLHGISTRIRPIAPRDSEKKAKWHDQPCRIGQQYDHNHYLPLVITCADND
jgi:hypothetical protein